MIKFMQNPNQSHSPRDLSAAFTVPTRSSGGKALPSSERQAAAQDGRDPGPLLPKNGHPPGNGKAEGKECGLPLRSAHSACLSRGLGRRLSKRTLIHGVDRTWVNPLSMTAQPPGLCRGAPSCPPTAPPVGQVCGLPTQARLLPTGPPSLGSPSTRVPNTLRHACLMEATVSMNRKGDPRGWEAQAAASVQTGS